MDLIPDQPRRIRQDGFTPERRAAFLAQLSGRRTVAAAMRAIGVTRKAAYDLRKRDSGFAMQWDEAVKVAKLPVNITFRSNRLNAKMWHLTRLDRHCARIRNDPLIQQAIYDWEHVLACIARNEVYSLDKNRVNFRFEFV